MDLKQLTYFITIARVGSFSRAALLLHVSQPSISNAISNLETEIGSPLFERTTRQIRLTKTGELLQDRSTELLKQFAIMKEELQDVIHGEEVKIVFGMIESAHNWFAQVIKDFKQQFPAIQFSVIDTLYNSSVFKTLENHDIHATISNQEINHNSITKIPLYQEKFVVIFPKGHPFSEKETVSLAEISKEPLITGMPIFETCKQILSAFETLHLTPQVAYEIERFEMAKSLVECHLGVSILPEKYVLQHFPESLEYRMIEDQILSRPVYLYYLKNRHFPNSILQLFQNIQNASYSK